MMLFVFDTIIFGVAYVWSLKLWSYYLL